VAVGTFWREYWKNGREGGPNDATEGRARGRMKSETRQFRWDPYPGAEHRLHKALIKEKGMKRKESKRPIGLTTVSGGNSHQVGAGGGGDGVFGNRDGGGAKG